MAAPLSIAVSMSLAIALALAAPSSVRAQAAPAGPAAPATPATRPAEPAAPTRAAPGPGAAPAAPAASEAPQAPKSGQSPTSPSSSLSPPPSPSPSPQAPSGQQPSTPPQPSQSSREPAQTAASQPTAALATCAACHGARGEGRAGAGIPRLAGQSADYLARQLAAYADETRPNPVMTPIAKGLDDGQRRALAEQYASMAAAPSAGARRAGDAKGGASSKRAATLANVGDASIGVQACANCHGPDGSGVPPTFPSLAGQHADYLVASMRSWRDGTRRTDPSGQMTTIAQRLREADLQPLADHFASRPAGAPRGGGDAAAALAPAPRAGAVARATEPSGPRRNASDPPAGTAGAPSAGAPPGGTGAAAPDSVRGGSQGIGGGGAGSGAGASGSGGAAR